MHRVPIHARRVSLLPSSPRTHLLEQSNHFHPRRMKCLLFPLIKKFEFSLVIPAEDIVWRNNSIVRRPSIKGAEREGPKLPLYVKVHVPDA